MRASVGDKLLVHGRTVGQHDRTARVVQVLGENGTPPYRVTYEDDGHESLMSPGPDTVVRRHPEAGTG
ncbi:DUF1918 domain-containing protein [Streptomyces sp. NPDC048659]|uniref:DUF1918 domain-containing protein n=1 Tax=Streptomyces sp. NPDC048659 TaxID=3155489 RepID=UPI00342B5F47